MAKEMTVMYNNEMFPFNYRRVTLPLMAQINVCDMKFASVCLLKAGDTMTSLGHVVTDTAMKCDSCSEKNNKYCVQNEKKGIPECST